MNRPRCLALRSAWLLLSVFALLGACSRRQTDDRLAGVPLSPELRPAIEASRRSLAAGDRGEPQVIADLDRYHALSELLYRRERRTEAADSLFALWAADPAAVLWPDFAKLNTHLLPGFARFDAMFARPDFPDSSTALGAFLREWQTLFITTRGEGFRRAWASRETLSPWQRSWLGLRLAYLEQVDGRAEAAAQLALEALPEARQAGGWRLEMEAWLTLARSLLLGDHLDDALHAARMAADLADAVSRKTGGVAVFLRSRQMEADVLAARREVEPALQLYGTCADSACAEGLLYYAGLSLNRAGILTGATGDYERGLDYYRRGLAIARADRDSLNIQRILANLARRHRQLGNLDSSLVYLREAERWIEIYPESGNRARFPLLQAEYYAQIGDFATVDSLLAAAASRQQRFSSVTAVAELHLELIKQGTERGRPAQAYRSIAVLDSLRERLGPSFADRNELVDLELSTAAFLGQQGLFARAAAALDRADSSLARRPDPGRLWELARERGQLARRRDDLEAAETAYRRCLELSQGRQDASRAAESRLSLASVLIDRREYAGVQALLSTSAGEAFGGRFRTRLSGMLLAAIADAREGRYEEAQRGFAAARALCRPESPPDLVARLDLEAGRVEAALGQATKARADYERVKAQLADQRRAAPLDADLFLDSDLRRELAECLLDLALGERRLLQGRAAELALHELESLLPAWQGRRRDEGTPLVRPQLVYFVGADRSYLWTLAADGISLTALPGESALFAALAPVLADLEHPGRPLVPAELSALSAALGGQPAGWLAGSALTIVPHGLLFAVPWPALQGSAGAESAWITQGPIRLVDAPAYESPAPDGGPRRGSQLLALGVDGSAAGRRAGLGLLHHAEREAREVAALWPPEQVVLRTGAAADWQRLAPAALAAFDVLHIASHALIYQGFADRTTLLLAGAGSTAVSSAEIAQLALNADLVFLSCCEAAEPVRRGIGPAHAGLARSFLAAGARTVIAPSARIDDEAARHLAQRFYAEWLRGGTAEAALRAAQLEMRSGDGRWAHPHYWACYQVIGSR